jgi:meiotically up-regulated gene 157 (Mug157) protein
MMWQRRALLPGRISTDVEPLLRHPQADAFMATSADKGAERDVTQLENK